MKHQFNYITKMTAFKKRKKWLKQPQDWTNRKILKKTPSGCKFEVKGKAIFYLW